MPSIEQLAEKQILPLEAKVRLAMMRVRAWYNHWEGEDVVVAIGESNAQVVLALTHLVREVTHGVLAVVEPEVGQHPIVPFMVETDSEKRKDWLKYGCNAFEAPHPECRPLAMWTREDVLEYLEEIKKKS